VTYNDWRGEPRTRGAKKAAAAGAPVGDCVDCNACVAVCPTGIDIRDGLQLECISCALCIDACNGIMDKLARPRGLISYTTLADYEQNRALATDPKTARINPSLIRSPDGGLSDRLRHFDWRIFFRLRTLIYAAAWSAVGLGLLFALISRDRLEVNVQKDRNPVFITLSDGSIRNGYTVKLLNMIPEPRVIFLSIEGLPGAIMSINGINQPDGVSFAVPVEPDKLRELKIFVSQPAHDVRPGAAQFRFVAADKQSFEHDEYVAKFEAPEK
jgi:cytochrome c oxidase accessory protein FixG